MYEEIYKILVKHLNHYGDHKQVIKMQSIPKVAMEINHAFDDFLNYRNIKFDLEGDIKGKVFFPGKKVMTERGYIPNPDLYRIKKADI